MGKVIFLLIVLTAGLLFPGCSQERDREAEIQAQIERTVEERVENYRQIRMERCRESILDEATRVTDSLLIVEARSEKETADRPSIPEKPVRPEIRLLQDTTPVKPLLPEEDTLMGRDTIKQR